MHAHKQREAAMDDLFAIMSRSGVPNQATMNVMCLIAKTKVSDCKICWFISVTAKKKKKTEPVCDCNYLACVIATTGCEENLTLSVWLTSYLVIWNMIASLDSV
jgi:hypothetical protein